jgi:phospholipase A1/A2
VNTLTIYAVTLFTSVQVWSQNSVIDSINNVMDNKPAFTIFKDNYFITGTSITQDRSNVTGDAKFQISFKERLTKSKLPFNSFLYVTYTQKSFWNIYQESSPFAETNYNPSIGLGRFIMTKKKLIAMVAIAYEHESNGRDSIFSRSWNRITLNYLIPLSKRDFLSMSVWICIAYKTDNPELIKYVGYGEASYVRKSLNNKFVYDLSVRKGTGKWNYGSIQAQMYYRLSKSHDKYLMLQYYKGHAESLIDFNTITSILRFGIVFKPSYFALD